MNLKYYSASILGVALLMLTPGAFASALPSALSVKPLVSQRLADSEYFPLSQASKHLQQGQTNEALNQFVETVEINPANILALYHLGNIYLDLAKQSEEPQQQAVFLEQAQQAFDRIVDLNSDLTLVYFKLGKLALMKNDIENAKKYYRMGLETEPGNAALIFNLARVYDQNNEKSQAIFYYQKTIEVDPHFTYAYNNLALMYEETKSYRNAEKAYRQALKMDRSYNLARLNLGNLYATMERYRDAQKQFAVALAQDPGNEWIYFYLGNMHLRMNAYEKAVQDYEKTLTLNPKHANSYYLMAIALTKLNRLDEALQAGLHYVQLEPNGDYAKEMKRLILTAKLTHSGGSGELIISPVSESSHH